MNVHERLKLYVSKVPNAEICENCKYFHHHYVFNEYRSEYDRIASGHCEYPRIKTRNSYDICEHFILKGDTTLHL